MKKAFKVIFIYLGVIILALLATVVFCAGFLFFYREGNIFGIQYISTKEVIYAKENEDMSGIQAIEVYSESYEVRIGIVEGVENLIGAMNNEVFGYTKKAKAHTSFKLEYNEDTKTAVFSSQQPKGWLNKKKSFIQIAIPESWADKEFDLIIKTEKADISVLGTDLLSVDNLVIDSNKGEASVSNLNIAKGIDVNIGSGLVYLDSTCSTTNGIDAVINVGSGTINFAKVDTQKFSFGTVEIRRIVKGKIGIIKAEELITNGNINGGGKIEVGEVGVVNFESLDTDIAVKTINGVQGSNSAKSIITITGYGDVFVETSKSNLEVNGYNGNINVNTITESAVLMSNQGDIAVYNAIKAIGVNTEYGDIYVNFVNSNAVYTPENGIKAIEATTKNGHIIIKGLQHGVITATDNGRISLSYDKIVGNNVIRAKTGAVNIVVPAPTSTSAENAYAFNLKVNSDVNSDIKVGVVGQLGGVDFAGSGSKEFSNIYNSESSTLNILNVSTSTGVIKIRSTDLIGF